MIDDAAYESLNPFLELTTPMLKAGPSILLIRQLVHAHAFPKPSTFAEHPLHWGARPLWRAGSDEKLIFIDILELLARRWCASTAPAA